MRLLLLILSFLVVQSNVHVDKVGENFIATVVQEVNRVRTTGCFCGNEYMPPTNEVAWNDVLYSSALHHAKDMTRNNYFSHFDRHGQDVGSRLDKFGYDWLIVGENLGEGQENFKEVMNDWMNSRTHCEMLMNPKVTEMGVAKHGRFWVQHFATPVPANAIKKDGKIFIPRPAR